VDEQAGADLGIHEGHAHFLEPAARVDEGQAAVAHLDDGDLDRVVPARDAGIGRALLEEDVGQLPQKVVRGDVDLAHDEGVVGVGDQDVVGDDPDVAAADEGDRQQPEGAGGHQGADVSADRDRDVAGFGEQGERVDRHGHRRQGALADDHRMQELHGDVLRVFGVAEREQRRPRRESFRHGPGGLGHRLGAALEGRARRLPSGELLDCGHRPWSTRFSPVRGHLDSNC